MNASKVSTKIILKLKCKYDTISLPNKIKYFAHNKSMCIFMPFGKNTDALFLHILFCVLCKRFCLATVGAMYFSVHGFGCALFYFGDDEMKKTVNQILALLLTVVMLLGVVPMTGITATAATQSGTCGDELTWNFNESTGELKIDGTGAMYDYEYGPRPWETYEDEIKNITIGNSVTTIGLNAFFDCVSLTSVTIPDSVTTIGDQAFAGCESLASVTIPDSVTAIGWNAFAFCENLSNITIPDSVTQIYPETFYHCSNLTSITIPDSVTSIESKAFAGCESLTSVTIPDSVTTIGWAVFGHCTNLASVTIGNSVTSIDWYAFYNCDSLTDVYYNGTEEEWNKITIEEEGNEPLLSATIHFKNAVGDPNNDGKINSSDALVCLQHSVGKIKLTDSAFTAADVDKNGKINSADALKILQYSVGKIEKL